MKHFGKQQRHRPYRWLHGRIALDQSQLSLVGLEEIHVLYRPVGFAHLNSYVGVVPGHHRR